MAANSSIPMQAIAGQVSKVKEEVYKVRKVIEVIPHAEQRERAEKLFWDAYEAFDALQSFLVSK